MTREAPIDLSDGAVHADSAREDAAEFAGRLARVRAAMQELGFDALVVSDEDNPTRKAGGNVRFLANVAAPVPFVDKANLIVVLPLAGEPTLVVPVTGFSSLPLMMERRSWIAQVRSAEPATFEERMRTRRAGAAPAEQMTARVVAEALEASGLAGSRIGLCGSFPGLAEMKDMVEGARFEAAVVEDDVGIERDPVELERSRTKSAWEVARMERAQDCAEQGARAFAAALVDGATYDDVYAELEYRTKRAGAQEVHAPSSAGRAKTGTFSQPGWWQGVYQAGDMVSFEINARVDGYWAQLPRTWVIGGKPTTRQARLYEAALRGFEAMRDRLEVGVSGAELWDVGFAAVEAAGFEPWSQYGHAIGLMAAEWVALVPGERARVQEGQSIVVHASAIDNTTGDQALLGEHFVMTDGRPRLLSRTGSPISLDIRPLG
jgi:Xaa-Pro aminopeptidase